MRTRPCETELETWKKGSMTKMMKLPVYAPHWPMRYDASIPWNQQKVRYTKREGHLKDSTISPNSECQFEAVFEFVCLYDFHEKYFAKGQ